MNFRHLTVCVYLFYLTLRWSRASWLFTRLCPLSWWRDSHPSDSGRLASRPKTETKTKGKRLVGTNATLSSRGCFPLACPLSLATVIPISSARRLSGCMLSNVVSIKAPLLSIGGGDDDAGSSDMGLGTTSKQTFKKCMWYVLLGQSILPPRKSSQQWLNKIGYLNDTLPQREEEGEREGERIKWEAGKSMGEHTAPRLSMSCCRCRRTKSLGAIGFKKSHRSC